MSVTSGLSCMPHNYCDYGLWESPHRWFCIHFIRPSMVEGIFKAYFEFRLFSVQVQITDIELLEL